MDSQSVIVSIFTLPGILETDLLVSLLELRGLSLLGLLVLQDMLHQLISG